MGGENIFSAAAELSDRSISGTIEEKDLDRIIAWPNEELPVLFAAADKVRRRFFGNRVDPCTLMNVKSGGCSEDCAFCAQSCHNVTKIDVRGLAGEKEIMERSAEAYRNKHSFCVVSSGRRLSKSEIGHIARTLTACQGEKHASLGILDKDDFVLLRSAGVVCYNHNIETSRRFFRSIVTTHSYDERIETVSKAREAGLKVCCGGILGLGETWEDRKAMALELKRLDVDTVPLNFLIPIAGIRLNPPVEKPLDFLKAVALFRLALPAKVIKVCGGREVHLEALQSLIFLAGANGYVSGGYLTTPGAGIESDNIMIERLGLTKRELSP